MVEMSDNCDSLNAREGLTAEQEAMLEALKRNSAIASRACSAAGISRQTHYRWLKENENYANAVDAIEKDRIDFATSKLHELIEGVYVSDKFGHAYYVCEKKGGKFVPVQENPVMLYKRPPCFKSIQLLLKCKGKDEGWTERTEITGANGDSMQQRVVYVDKEDKQNADAHIDGVIHGGKG